MINLSHEIYQNGSGSDCTNNTIGYSNQGMEKVLSCSSHKVQLYYYVVPTRAARSVI